MDEGYIDSATIYGAFMALSGDPSSADEWAWQSAVEATYALCKLQHLKLPAGPDRHVENTRLYARFLNGLSGSVHYSKARASTRSGARELTHDWAVVHSRSIRAAYRGLTSSTHYEPWLEWNIANGWGEHVRRLGGIVDEGFLSPIAAVLDVAESDLQDVARLTRNPGVVDDLAAQQPNTTEFELLRDAYVVSSLLRGAYYCLVAEDADRQILLHPFRQYLLPATGSARTTEITPSNTAVRLTHVLLASASLERELSERVGRWAASVATVRANVLSGRYRLDPQDNATAAIDEAVRIAKDLNIVAHSSRFARRLDDALSVGSGAAAAVLTTFIISDWEAVLAAVGIGEVARRLTRERDLGSRAASLITDRRVRRVAEGAPAYLPARGNWQRSGMIGRRWS